MSLPIGFFSPLPLPIMVPFMFMQSAAMALGFGSFFQYGKRKLSAMSNEEFNALTPEALTAQLMSSVNNMIPTVQQSFREMEKLNVLILNAMATYFTQGVEYLGGFLSGKNVPTTIGGSTFSPSNIPSGLSEVTGLSGLNDYLNQLNLDTGQQSDATLSDNQFVPQTSTTKVRVLYLKFHTWKLSELRRLLKIENRPLEKSIMLKVFNEKIQKLRTEGKIGSTKPIPPSTLVSIQKPMGRNEKLLHNKLTKYFTLYKNGLNTIAKWKTTVEFLQSKNRSIGSYRTNISKLQKKVNLYRDIFNVALKQSRNYKALTSLWGPIKSLQ